ncbi:MAG: hypothetical protein RR975_02815 [Clostridia bacterium]
MEKINTLSTECPQRAVRVLQFGEGNFLRAFVDDMLDIANEKTDFNGSVVIVKPIAFGSLETFHQQDCKYTAKSPLFQMLWTLTANIQNIAVWPSCPPFGLW